MSDWKDNYTDLVEHSYNRLEQKTIEHRSWSEEAKQRVRQAHAAGMSVAEYFGEAVRKAKSKYNKAASKSNSTTSSAKKKKIIKRVTGPIRKANGKYMTNGEMRDSKEWARSQALPNRNKLRNAYKKQTVKGLSLKTVTEKDRVNRTGKSIISDSNHIKKRIGKKVGKTSKDVKKYFTKDIPKQFKQDVNNVNNQLKKKSENIVKKAVKKGVQAKMDTDKALKKLDKKAVKNFKSVGKSNKQSASDKVARESIKTLKRRRKKLEEWHKEYDVNRSKKAKKRLKEVIKKEDERYAKEQYNNSVKGKIENSVRKLLKGKKKKTSKKK